MPSTAGGASLATPSLNPKPSLAATQVSVPASALGHTSTLTAAPAKDSRDKETPSITPQVANTPHQYVLQ
jgi:hypothetical protein